MKSRFLAPLAAVAGSVCLSLAWCGEPSATTDGKPKDRETAGSAQSEPDHRVPLGVARDRAKVMQSIYTATLDVIHDRYFHGDRAIVPARAMEDVFSQMDRELSLRARWISVNTKAMSIDHEPKTDFEKAAARQLAEGKSEFEQVENGHYSRATPIALGSGCIACHAGFFSAPPKSPRFAGLVITIPIRQD